MLSGRHWSHIQDFQDLFRRIFIICRCPSFRPFPNNGNLFVPRRADALYHIKASLHYTSAALKKGAPRQLKKLNSAVTGAPLPSAFTGCLFPQRRTGDRKRCHPVGPALGGLTGAPKLQPCLALRCTSWPDPWGQSLRGSRI